jgi:hypothetical protein
MDEGKGGWDRKRRVAHVGNKRKLAKKSFFWGGKPTGDRLKDLGLNGRIITK